MTKKKLCLVCSSDLTVKFFLIDHIRNLQNKYYITLVGDFSEDNFSSYHDLKVKFIHIPIRRNFNLVYDLWALFSLIFFFLKVRFDIIQSLTPKAGLLTQLAAFITINKKRVHFITGQVWAHRKNKFTAIGLIFFDVVTAILAKKLLCDSYSQVSFLKKTVPFVFNKVHVMGYGSISGVNLTKFDRRLSCERTNSRALLNLDVEHVIGIYLGRLSNDKGVADLIAALPVVFDECPNFSFIFVGPDEENLGANISNKLTKFMSRCKTYGYTHTPEKFLAIADFLVLPSYREGFGSSVIEAGAMGLPAIVSDIYGLRDSALPTTSLSFPVGCVKQLTDVMIEMICNDKMRLDLSNNAYKRSINFFDSRMLVRELENFYEEL